MKKINLALHWQIIICMILGTVAGVYFNSIDYTTNNIYSLIILSLFYLYIESVRVCEYDININYIYKLSGRLY